MSHLREKLVLTAFASMSFAACASAPRPPVLDTAEARFADPDVEELEGLRPRLMREARSYLNEAETAQGSGEPDRAELLAHLAVQRFDTARNLVARDAAEQLTTNMQAADAGLGAQLSARAEEARERARYAALEGRFEDVDSALERARARTDAAAGRAQKLLLQARARQAQALEAGVASRDPEGYGRARMFVDNALEAYDAGLYPTSEESSKSALDAFDALLAAPLAAPVAAPATEVAIAEPARPAPSLGITQTSTVAAARPRPRAVAESEVSFEVPEESRRPRGETGRAAEDVWVRLQLERAAALGREVPERCPAQFAEFEAVMEVARQRLDIGDYPRAIEIAARASERLARCAPAAEAGPPRKPTAQERAEEEREAAASDKLARAQAEYALLAIEHPDNPELRKPAALVASAEQWMERQGYLQTSILAEQALEALSVARAAAPLTERAGPVEASAKVSSNVACEEAEDLAEAVDAAQLVASRASTDPDRQERYQQAVKAGVRARALLSEKRCASAKLLLEATQSLFEELSAASTTPAVSTSASGLSAPPATSATGPESALAYARILEVGRLEREARLEATDDEASRLDAAQKSLAAAKKAWSSGDLEASDRETEAARQLLEGILSSARTRQAAARDAEVKAAVQQALAERGDAPVAATSDPDTERALEEARAEAEAARSRAEAAEAERARAVEDAAQARRDAEARAAEDAEKAQADAASRARLAAAESARAEADAERQRAEEAARAEQARLSAEAASKAESERADKARANAEAESKRQAQLRRSAQDALRAARVQSELCARRACEGRDEERSIRAAATLGSAEQALAAGELERAADLAQTATQLFEEALSKPRRFVVPDEARQVSRRGDALYVTPPLVFVSGGATLLAESIPSVDALAAVLRANAELIERTTLVGFTDDRGDAKRNLALSKARAEAVQSALVARGVGAGQLAAEGKGEADPIASNYTREGRERNRRVEVRLQMR